MGGMQVLEWAALYPHRVFAAMPIAASARHSAQNIAFHEVGRQAVMADPDWCSGRYLEEGARPRKGLAVARMGAHVTYLSESALHRKFGRRLQARDAPTFSFDADFQIESYLRHQGITFVERFDANSYLYVTRAMDYFDLADEHGGRLADAFRGSKTRFFVMSFTSDWLFPTEESRAVVARAQTRPGASVSFVEVESDKGHDAFLLDEPDMFRRSQGLHRRRRRGAGDSDDDGASAPSPRLPPARAAPPRKDHLLLAEQIAPGARVLDVGCGDGALLALLRDRNGVDGRGNRDRARQRRRRPRPGPAGDPGRRGHRPRRLSRRRVRLRRPVPDDPGDAPARARCSSTCCASASGPSSRSPISAIGASGSISACAGACP